MQAINRGSNDWTMIVKAFNQRLFINDFYSDATETMHDLPALEEGPVRFGEIYNSIVNFLADPHEWQPGNRKNMALVHEIISGVVISQAESMN